MKAVILQIHAELCETMDTFGNIFNDSDEDIISTVNTTSEAINLYLDIFDQNGNTLKNTNEAYCPITEDISDMSDNERHIS